MTTNETLDGSTIVKKFEAFDRLALHAISLISKFLMLFAGVALVLMMTQVTVDVVGKFLLNQPVPMTLELVSNYYMVAVVFLPLAAVELIDGNIKVDLIYTHLPRVMKRSLDLVAYLFATFLFWFLTTSTWNVAVKKYHVGEFIMGSYSVPIWQSRFLVPIGCALVCALLILKLLRTALHLIRPDLDDADGPNARPRDDDPLAGTAI
ncbi:TRAP transporter small permease subunit [Thalassovita taeanensis]|uniref:TRAP transporter small permease protein n=1 Tax=Thalassovita taeanensis TaxID=657014 RepID=A0A1H9H972_9RHOB|nr:TRAP transporter small permease [Thalassovita taeanensis]SEQ58929.1 TRAP-type mannitol/chloroaromatic compound transport system, small permease component [Thalassovita taeanensis]